MTLVFISSTGDHAGQTLFTWAMARRLLEKGLRVGLLKPFGNHPVQIGDLWTDSDAVLFKEVLHLEAALGLLCPFPGGQAPETHRGYEEIVKKLKGLVRELSRGSPSLQSFQKIPCFPRGASGKCWRFSMDKSFGERESSATR
jgi:hypothetical protein